MYDAKKGKLDTNECLKGDCIKDRSYFTNIENTISMGTKSSLVPIENLIPDFSNNS